MPDFFLSLVSDHNHETIKKESLSVHTLLGSALALVWLSFCPSCTVVSGSHDALHTPQWYSSPLTRHLPS